MLPLSLPLFCSSSYDNLLQQTILTLLSRHVLSNEVLTFVNKIAEIVHSNVHNWRGQCNKNLGNAFIVVWRIGDQSTLLVRPLTPL